MIEKDGNNSLSIEYKEEILIIFQKSMDLLTSSILYNNTDQHWKFSSFCLHCFIISMFSN